MDSGNSDSFQSSNGGDEEYNSSRGGISAFINQAAATSRGGLVYNTPPHQSTNHTMFDPILSNYQNLQNNIFPKNNNHDMVWSEPIPNCTETINTLTSQNQPFTIHQNSNNLPSSSLSSVQEIMNTTTSRSSSLPSSDHHQTHGLPSVRNQNPKKRSRASRRAPTTVLTTDTTNFRAMVQEFTGIPAPPFTSSSLFPRNNNTKLDNLFGTPSSSMRLSNPLDYSISLSSTQPPPYLRRPFPQKAQPLVPPSSSSMFGASMVDSLRTNVDDSYQRLQSSNIFTMQNPILTSLLHSNHPKPTLAHNNSYIFGTKTHHGSVQMQSANGFLQGPVDNNASLGELPGLVSADPARWGGGDGGANGGGGDQVRSFGNNNNGGCDDLARNVENGKRLKGMMEDGARSSEGMMETWICSSSE
ncbi:hypothetical protein LIER_39717 [Lithospermum erythrorhizon]|uniref:VQ domain-containing protein n=1 Tax=Lithospermum erythrorhizon TaxID=34254 RepID=A0AAV3QMV2_LITER